MTQRLVISIFSLITLMMVSGHAPGQTFPDRTIKIIVPSPAGGAGDVSARLVAQGMARVLGKPVIIENKPGASSIIGVTAAAKSEPDGYTLALIGKGQAVLNPLLYKELQYDMDRDFASVAVVNKFPWIFATSSESSAKNLGDFVSLAKAKPNALFYSTFGAGSTNHVLTLMFEKMAGVKMTMVPYAGGAHSLTALLSGQVQSTIDTTGNLLPNIKAGKLRALAVTSGTRLSELPDVPTFAEAGFPLEDYSWTALFTNRAVPREIVIRLNDAVNQALRMPEIRDRLIGWGYEPGGGSASDLANLVAKEKAAFAPIIRDADIRL
ncbi:MAG: tripartite tricarboxylate transporter substrate binding protein [Chthoniobacteraceae bacterium]